jgi:hypothetical protein
MIAARLRRQVVERKGLLRLLLWGDRPGYLGRPASAPSIASVEEPAAPPRRPSPRADTAAVIELEGARPSPVAAAAGLLGLSVEPAARVGELADMAVAGDWPLIASSLQALAGTPQSLPASVRTFVRGGGTLFVDGLDERSSPSLGRLGDALGVGLPEVWRAAQARHLLFPADGAGFAGELAGTRLGAACGGLALEPVANDEVLAWSVADERRSAAVVQRNAGRGRVVVSALPRPAPDRLADVMESDQAGGFVAALLLLREVYGGAAWHAPAVLANFTIDDPALRGGGLGLRYDRLATQARDHGFHVTIATVPRELGLAEEAVVRLLLESPGVVSACYHGCDHDGYEFYLTSGRRMRHRPRRLEEQRAALRRAVDHGRRFTEAHRLELDRVMVFPHGIGPARLFGDLRRLGFLATCNLGDRYPLEAPVPTQGDLGLRPADLAWEGFPLLWRRHLRDDGYLLDVLLGRPVLFFTHRRAAGPDFARLVEQARLVNRVTHGAAVWRGLDEVARHAYLQRRVPGSGWQALLTANEACLHNPELVPRTYAVTRPHVPEGCAVEVDGRTGSGPGPLLVTVPPRSTAVVELVARDGGGALRGPRRCTVMEPGADLTLDVAG